MPETISFIGIGNMGSAMAKRLLNEGFSLLVWNRTRNKAETLQSLGARIADSAAESVNPAGILISMVSDDSALVEVSLKMGVLERLGKDGLHISMSTVSPETSRKLWEAHSKIGAQFLCAPVFGRPEHAEEGKLFICVSGDTSAKERARPILSAMSQGIYDFGEDVGSANVIKLIGNFMICAMKEIIAEAFALGKKNKIEPKVIGDFFSETLFNAPIFRRYSELISEHKYEPAGFRLALGLKDMKLLAEVSVKSKVPMPFADIIRNRLLAGVAKGRGELDWSALALSAFEDAGLQ